MAMLKTCVGEGCTVHPTFGTKAVGQNDYVWACKAHQQLSLRPAVKATLDELLVSRKLQSTEQGRLL